MERYRNGEHDGKKVTVAASYQGPLPPPEMLQAYNETIAGSGELILEEFRKQGQHRRRAELLVILGQLYIGPVIAVSVVLSAFFFGFRLLMDGKSVGGFGTFFAPLALLGGLFVWNRIRGR